MHRAYLTLTAHWISSSWVLHARTISFREIPQQNGMEIKHFIKEQLSAVFSPTVLLSAITTDGGSAFRCAGRDLVADDASHCAAHLLQLAIEDALKACPDVKEAVAVVHSLHVAMRNNKVLRAELVAAGGCPSLPLDCPTRWSSTYDMCSAFIAECARLQCMEDLMRQEKVPETFLPSKDLEYKIRQFVDVLLPCKELTTDLQGDKYVSMAVFLQHYTMQYRR